MAVYFLADGIDCCLVVSLFHEVVIFKSGLTSETMSIDSLTHLSVLQKRLDTFLCLILYFN